MSGQNFFYLKETLNMVLVWYTFNLHCIYEAGNVRYMLDLRLDTEHSLHRPNGNNRIEFVQYFSQVEAAYLNICSN